MRLIEVWRQVVYNFSDRQLQDGIIGCFPNYNKRPYQGRGIAQKSGLAASQTEGPIKAEALRGKVTSCVSALN